MVSVVSVKTKPFSIERRYRSMEGPFATYPVRLGADPGETRTRELWWWKGAKIVVLDEKGEDLRPEFMRHLNVDLDSRAHRGAFPGVSDSRRLLTLTQGEMSFRLPGGRGVPIASDELAVDYQNPTDRAGDSMTSLGLFVHDPTFKRPAWADRTAGGASDMASCGLGPEGTPGQARSGQARSGQARSGQTEAAEAEAAQVEGNSDTPPPDPHAGD